MERLADRFRVIAVDLYGSGNRSEFGFLHEVFESFVVEDWRGLVRGQHRFLSAATRRNSQWMPAEF